MGKSSQNIEKMSKITYNMQTSVSSTHKLRTNYVQFNTVYRSQKFLTVRIISPIDLKRPISNIGKIIQNEYKLNTSLLSA